MVIIDPGHGGIDYGGGTNVLWNEKDLVLDISTYQQQRLEELGIPVYITRTTDEYVGPRERASRINNAFSGDTSALVISNHINVDRAKLDGADIIYSKFDDASLANAFAEGFIDVGQNIRGVYTRENSSGNDYYYIIRDTRPRRTTLLEYGFADSVEDDVSQLAYNWPNLAESVVRTISEYYGVPYQAPRTTPYVVQSGDTVFSIANRFGFDEAFIYSINNFAPDRELVVGETIQIPYNENYTPNTGNDDSSDLDDSINYIEYVVESGDTLYSIANRFGLTVNEIKQANNLISDIIVPGQVLVLNIDDSWLIHIVKPGDTLYGISRRYNLSVDEIKRLNDLTSDTIYPGQLLYLFSTPSELPDNFYDYTVLPGDSLYKISNMFGTTIDEIKRINDLTTNIINIGQTLKVPISYELTSYTVSSGDTLWQIARRYDTTIDRIMALNGLTSTIIYPGQVLQIPV